VADAVVLALPWGLMAGRIGNFINGELYGRVAELPWAMVFPQGGPLPRHPSQLYEAMLEGPVLFLFMWAIRQRTRPGQLAGWFLMAYAFLRFAVEFAREPDPQIGLLLGLLTMGQVLCIFQFALGLMLWLWRRRAGSA
jgi:phosphatidylglycerol:prolipoprotein diacylglycerol transferase